MKDELAYILIGILAARYHASLQNPALRVTYRFASLWNKLAQCGHELTYSEIQHALDMLVDAGLIERIERFEYRFNVRAAGAVAHAERKIG